MSNTINDPIHSDDTVPDEDVVFDIKESHSKIVSSDLLRGLHWRRMPMLELVSERFSILCSKSLSYFIHANVSITPISIDTQHFGAFMREAQPASCGSIVSLAPLPGQMLIIFNNIRSLIQTKYNYHSNKLAVRLSSLDAALVTPIINEIVNNLETVLSELIPFKLKNERIETYMAFFSIFSPSDTIVTITFEYETNIAADNITLCIPTKNLAPIKDLLHSSWMKMDSPTTMYYDKQLQKCVEKAVAAVSVSCSAYMSADVPRSTFKQIKEGNTIRLGNVGENDVTVSLNGVDKFRGTLIQGKTGNTFKIERMIPRSDPPFTTDRAPLPSGGKTGQEQIPSDPTDAGDLFSWTLGADAKNLFQLLADEHPCTIAIIIERLPSGELAFDILRQFPEEIQKTVLCYMAGASDMPLVSLSSLDGCLREQYNSLLAHPQVKPADEARTRDIMVALGMKEGECA
jgi:flagellar motor switch protein FliM